MDIQRRQYFGDLSGYKDLVEHYNSKRQSTSEAQESADEGWTFYKKGDEVFISHSEQGDVNLKAAMKSGMLNKKNLK